MKYEEKIINLDLTSWPKGTDLKKISHRYFYENETDFNKLIQFKDWECWDEGKKIFIFPYKLDIK